MIRGALAGAGLVVCCAGLARVPNLAQAPGTFLALFSLAFLCYGTGIWLLARARGVRAIVLILAVAGAARLVLLPAPPTLSTDVYRYVWDARVARAGISPYAHAPEAPELSGLRDDVVYPRLNHATWRTIYPPAAQAFFAAVYAVRPDSVLAMKIALGVAEAVGLVLLFGLLRACGVSAARAVIYAWNPLVLVEIWGGAHLDAIVIPAVIGGTWAAVAGRPAPAGAVLGLGIAVKLYPAALVPLLLWGPGLLPGMAGVLAVVAACYAPAWSLGAGALGSLPRYLSEEYFNPGLLRSIVDVPGLTAAAALTWTIWVASRRRELPLARCLVPLIGGLVLLSPNIFPWYALWLVPFLAVAPSVPWIAFTGTVASAYAFFLQEPWTVPAWARAIEFAPVAAGALWWAVGGRAVTAWRERSA
jgi:alpha-1,6-mannosyltransferase